MFRFLPLRHIKKGLLIISYLPRVFEVRLLWMARLLLLVGYNNSFLLDGFQFKMIILESQKAKKIKE